MTEQRGIIKNIKKEACIRYYRSNRNDTNYHYHPVADTGESVHAMCPQKRIKGKVCVLPVKAR